MSDSPQPHWRRYLRFWRSNVSADVDDELQFHLRERVDELMALGLDETAAREQALRRFGDVEGVKESCRTIAQLGETTMRRAETLDVLRQDLVYTFRVMRTNVAFTAAVVLTLALGIGATTAIFSVVNAVLLQPLPYDGPDRIVRISETLGGGPGNASAGHYHDWREQSRSFDAVAAAQGRSFTFTDGEPTRIPGAQVTPSFFQVLRVSPALGRYFLPDETAASRVVVLSHSLWQTRFAGDSSIVGKSITLSGEAHTVVGITPEAFSLTPRDTRLWTILTFQPGQRTNYGAHTFGVIGKLKPGLTLAQAQRDLERITDDIRRREPKNMIDRGVQAQLYRETLIGNYDAQLWVLLGAVTFVLLIGCGNVASLLLARATARRKEIAIRGALGGDRWRLVRQLLTESLGLSLLGGAAGLIVAHFGLRFLKGMGPAWVPRLGESGLQADVLLFALVATLVCGLLFGMAPALRATRVDLQGELREGGRGSRAVVRDRTRAALIVTEIAVSLVLLVSAGLLLRSAVRLQRIPLGFDPSGVTMLRVALPADRYGEAPAVQSAFTRIVEGLRTIPGVENAAASTRVPMWGGSIDIGVRVDGRAPDPNRVLVGHVRIVTSGFLEAMRIPVVRGRALRESDMSAGAPSVVVVNQEFARSVFSEQNPIGQRISGWTRDTAPEWREIVGVTGNVRAFGQEVDIPPEIYMPISQVPNGAWNAFQRSMAVVVKARPGALVVPSVRKAVGAVDPLLPMYDVQTMDDVLSQSTSTRRFNTLLLSLLGVTGLVLAAIGIYGVIAFFVSQRTHEIGVRVALGASTRSVVRMVVRQAMLLATVGVLVGAVLALGSTRLLASMLFEVGPRDPIAFVAGAAALLLVALGAAWLPARRAALVDPVRALSSSG
jgi:putative ABC transport system permease protein